jgi:hypothetical protein
MKKDTEFSIIDTSYRSLVKSFIFTISTLFIISTESSARSNMNTCLPWQKTQCGQCYKNTFTSRYFFLYNCCDQNFKNCWKWNGYGGLNVLAQLGDMSACQKARDAFGCDESCDAKVVSRHIKASCPSDKK